MFLFIECGMMLSQFLSKTIHLQARQSSEMNNCSNDDWNMLQNENMNFNMNIVVVHNQSKLEWLVSKEMENRLRSKVIIILWLRWMKLCKFKRIFRSNLYTNRWCNKITFSNCVQKAIITLHTNLIKLSILCGTNVNKISNKYLSMLTMMAHCQWLWLWQYTYNTTIEQFLICTMHVNEFICAKGYSKYLLCQCIGTLLLIRVHHTYTHRIWNSD